MVKLIVGYGLPGSGKTTLLKKMYNNLRRNNRSTSVIYFDVDKHIKEYYKKKNLEDVIEDYFDCYGSTKREIIVLIDGLFTTNDDLIKLINIFKKFMTVDFDVVVEWFEENRDACIWNDEYRRNETSITAIKNLSFEKPHQGHIEDETGVKIKMNSHIVERKSKDKHYADSKGLCNEEGILRSRSWCLGGTYCDCWGNTSAVAAESPLEFVEFDEMLEKICPEINFLKYKKLRNECVTIETYGEPDYYGGRVNNAYYVCDVMKLLSMMDEMGISLED